MIDALEAKAMKGDVAAARELREWRKAKAVGDVGEQDLDVDMALDELDTAQRERLLTRLLRELVEVDEKEQSASP